MSLHAARLDRSPRLQRTLAALRDGEWHSTRDILRDAHICAVNSCIAELRANGYVITCQQRIGSDGRRLFFYRLEEDAGGQRLLFSKEK